MDRYTTEHYFEAHVTIDPVFDDELDAVKFLAGGYEFRVADLLKRNSQPSEKDTFASARSNDFHRLNAQTVQFVQTLKEYGFGVRRYKIENILVDVRL